MLRPGDVACPASARALTTELSRAGSLQTPASVITGWLVVMFTIAGLSPAGLAALWAASRDAEGAEERRGEELLLSPFSASLSEALRLCVNSGAPASKSGYSKRKEATMEDMCDVVQETGFAIHRYHKHGHLEKVYENALAHQLREVRVRMK